MFVGLLWFVRLGEKKWGEGGTEGDTERKERNYWWVKTLAQLLSTARCESYYMNFQKLTPSPAPYPIPSHLPVRLFFCWVFPNCFFSPADIQQILLGSCSEEPTVQTNILILFHIQCPGSLVHPWMTDDCDEGDLSALAASSWVTCSLLKSTPLKHMDFRRVQLRWWLKKGPLPMPCWEITEKKGRHQRTDRRKLRDKLSPKLKKKIWRRGQSRVSSTSGKWVQLKGVLPSLLRKVRYFNKSSLSLAVARILWEQGKVLRIVDKQKRWIVVR